MRTREEIEALEDKVLAPYAMKSKDSAGRQFPEEAHPVRTCYQRDRDRIVHSEAFRKLEYKTQVFIVFEGDYYRTRLTHTIEVAQIARTIGRNLRLNEDLIEAVALAHDLGHPPFGHAGEEALDDILKSAKLNLQGFNHNKRSFDIVTKFEKRYPAFDGLNLTREVLVGILKHKTVYDQAGFDAQLKEEPTLEAKVVDVADSLAYLTHDIDDGLTSGCINEEDLMESELWQKVYQHIHATLVSKDREMLKYQIVKMLVDMQMKDLLTYSDQRIQEKNFKSSADVKSFRGDVIGFSPDFEKKRDHLQALLNKKLYHHHRVERMTGKARRIIRDLFEVYKSNPHQLPYTIYRRDIPHDEKAKYEICCNHIASMTDRFALDEHKRLFDPYQKV
jgi:dGTPase